MPNTVVERRLKVGNRDYEYRPRGRGRMGWWLGDVLCNEEVSALLDYAWRDVAALIGPRRYETNSTGAR
jgi:hypothetical protein